MLPETCEWRCPYKTILTAFSDNTPPHNLTCIDCLLSRCFDTGSDFQDTKRHFSFLATFQRLILMMSSTGLLQGTFLPANVAQQLDDMQSHTTLLKAATRVKHHYARLQAWKSTLLKQSMHDLAGVVAADDISTEIENVLLRYCA